jgi:UDP-N-acetylmuramoyl-tripeptide--D-alanyl-D-alanine ligase
METEELYTIYLQHPVITTDTRKISQGSLFFALKGENFDANTFAANAIEAGAAYAVIDNAEYKAGPKYILVDDVLMTLQNLARHHRRQLSIPVVGLTGTNGKTTTKELINAVLSEQFNTLATQGNLNNHIGVPLTLLSISKEIEIAIIEIGANHLDETYDLCKIAEPNYGVVTNNGKDHLEGFGSIENVTKANAELFDWLRETNGTAFVNQNYPDLVKSSEGLKRINYGRQASNDFSFESFPGMYASIKDQKTKIPANLQE